VSRPAAAKHGRRNRRKRGKRRPPFCGSCTCCNASARSGAANPRCARRRRAPARVPARRSPQSPRNRPRPVSWITLRAS
jgi:hypothetical protein